MVRWFFISFHHYWGVPASWRKICWKHLGHLCKQHKVGDIHHASFQSSLALQDLESIKNCTESGHILYFQCPKRLVSHKPVWLFPMSAVKVQVGHICQGTNERMPVTTPGSWSTSFKQADGTGNFTWHIWRKHPYRIENSMLVHECFMMCFFCCACSRKWYLFQISRADWFCWVSSRSCPLITAIRYLFDQLKARWTSGSL